MGVCECVCAREGVEVAEKKMKNASSSSLTGQKFNILVGRFLGHRQIHAF